VIASRLYVWDENLDEARVWGAELGVLPGHWAWRRGRYGDRLPPLGEHAAGNAAVAAVEAMASGPRLDRGKASGEARTEARRLVASASAEDARPQAAECTKLRLERPRIRSVTGTLPIRFAPLFAACDTAREHSGSFELG